ISELVPDLCLGPPHDFIIAFRREPVVAAGLAGPKRYHRQHSRPARAPAIHIEDHVRSASLRYELRSHALGKEYRTAANARSFRTRHGASRHILVLLWLKYLKLDSGRLASGPLYPTTKRPLAAGLLAEPGG